MTATNRFAWRVSYVQKGAHFNQEISVWLEGAHWKASEDYIRATENHSMSVEFLELSISTINNEQNELSKSLKIHANNA